MNMLTENFATRTMDSASHAVRHAVKTERKSEHHSPAVLLLDVNGYIQECGNSIEELCGYSQHELLWQHISCLFPKLGEIDLLQNGKLNPMLNYICHCDHIFEAMHKKSGIIVCNLNFFMVEHAGGQNLRLIVRPVVAANA
jgi:hypothetical protein